VAIGNKNWDEWNEDKKKSTFLQFEGGLSRFKIKKNEAKNNNATGGVLIGIKS
jgi:hypothetical protein